jgi:hypothetical protein
MWRQGRRQGRKTRRVAYFSAAERRKDEDSISRSKKRQKAEQWGKTGIRRRGLASRYRARQVEVDDAKKNNCWQINQQGGAGQLPNRLCSCQLDAFLAGTRTCSFELYSRIRWKEGPLRPFFSRYTTWHNGVWGWATAKAQKLITSQTISCSHFSCGQVL